MRTPAHTQVDYINTDKSDARWEEKDQPLGVYKKEHKDTNVTIINKKDPKLGTWKARDPVEPAGR